MPSPFSDILFPVIMIFSAFEPEMPQAELPVMLFPEISKSFLWGLISSELSTILLLIILHPDGYVPHNSLLLLLLFCSLFL